MDWEDALEAVVARTRHERFRVLCADGHPDREAWRRKMVEMATPRAPAPAYPPPATQAMNLAGAVGRVVAAAARGEPIRVPPRAFDERLGICLPCEFNGLRGAVRCTKCGCGGIKLQLATEQCPAGKWGRWESPGP